ncbi:hypothetical protein [Alteribacter natronophilus]|uniref:hypothetical protein n=1 Tax=Alteribacter natronophilus TaxID=2583810 RepID=UPI00110D41D2|nr:hypothetical protein [Alteribacter natronophilus]TMW70441.1 hypothetical protein FGB90_17400 [Alteribacter natronophilus]
MKGLMKMMVPAGILFLFLSAACSGQEYLNDKADAAHPVVSETQSGDFLIRLVSDRAVYEETDHVELKAKLKYIGDEPQVTISHRTSPFWYRIHEITRGVDIPYVQDSPGSVMTLERDVWYEEQYVRRGATEGENGDRDQEFIRSFTQGPHFPPGEYEIELNSDFFIEKDGERKKHIMATGLVLTVE